MTDIREVVTPDGPMAVRTMPARAVKPQGAVVVLHDSTGLDNHIQSVLGRFAGSGYLAVAPDLFHRADNDATLTRAMVLDDVDAVLDALRGDGWNDEQIGVVGYGIGGGVAFVVAAQRALGAAVSLYPRGISDDGQPRLAHLPDDALQIQTPWLGQFGERDEMLPSAQVDELEPLLGRGSRVFAEVVRLRRAGHRFDRERLVDHAADAAFEAWERTIEWLERRLEPPPTEFAAMSAERSRRA